MSELLKKEVGHLTVYLHSTVSNHNTILLLLFTTHVDTDDSYPDDLIAHGLTNELLISSMSEIEAGKATVWSLSGRIPTIGFYRALHYHLKQHFKATKTAIGKLYCGIDSNLKEKGSRPDNIYRFVERVISIQKS